MGVKLQGNCCAHQSLFMEFIFAIGQAMDVELINVVLVLDVLERGGVKEYPVPS